MLRRPHSVLYLLAAVYITLAFMAWTYLTSSSGQPLASRTIQGRESVWTIPTAVASLGQTSAELPVHDKSARHTGRRMLVATKIGEADRGASSELQNGLGTLTNIPTDRNQHKDQALGRTGKDGESNFVLTKFQLLHPSDVRTQVHLPANLGVDSEDSRTLVPPPSPYKVSQLAGRRGTAESNAFHTMTSFREKEDPPIFAHAMRVQYHTAWQSNRESKMVLPTGKSDNATNSTANFGSPNPSLSALETLESTAGRSESKSHHHDKLQDAAISDKRKHPTTYDSPSKSTGEGAGVRLVTGPTASKSPGASAATDSTRARDLSIDTSKSCVGNIYTSTRPLLGKLPLETLIRNCTELRKYNGYDDIPVDEEELDFPLAFSIKMHTSAEQAEQLLRTIYRPNNVYCIHVDQKADDVIYRTMTSLSVCFDNVIVVKDRVNVVYASSGFVKAEVKCMETALKSRVPWKYYINFAGQEFPLKTNLEMVRILKLFNGTNDIESYPMPSYLAWRIEKKFKVVGNSLVMTSEDKKKTNEFKIRKGSAYGSFSRAFVTSVMTDHVAQAVIQWFNDTYAPEENVWSTINSLPWIPGGYPVEVRHDRNQHASRTVAWKWDSYACRGEYRRSVCIFTIGDLPWLMKRPQLVANKFDVEKGRDVLDCLERILFQRAKERNVSVDWTYFENLPHVKFYRERLRQKGFSPHENPDFSSG